jgi:hypothetical protein
MCLSRFEKPVVLRPPDGEDQGTGVAYKSEDRGDRRLSLRQQAVDHAVKLLVGGVEREREPVSLGGLW